MESQWRKLTTNNTIVYKIEHDTIIGNGSLSYSWVKFKSVDKKYSCGPFKLIDASVISQYTFSIKVHSFQDFQPMELEHGFVLLQQNGTTENDPIGTPLDVYDPDNDFYDIWFHKTNSDIPSKFYTRTKLFPIRFCWPSNVCNGAILRF